MKKKSAKWRRDWLKFIGENSGTGDTLAMCAVAALPKKTVKAFWGTVL
jgi:hypothetical protein